MLWPRLPGFGHPHPVAGPALTCHHLRGLGNGGATGGTPLSSRSPQEACCAHSEAGAHSCHSWLMYRGLWLMEDSGGSSRAPRLSRDEDTSPRKLSPPSDAWGQSYWVHSAEHRLLAGSRKSSQKRCVLDVFWTYLSVVSWGSKSGVPISRPRTWVGIKPVLWVHHGATCPAGHHG